VIFLAPVEQLWNFFEKMNSTQMLALATEDMTETSWYINSNKVPLPTKYSLNTGIILMNLTRMREVNFFDDLEPIVIEYGNDIKWFVNDVMGIYLYNNPDKYLELPCSWNYLTDHCRKDQLCESAELNGVAVLHGSRSSFFLKTEPSFKAVYSVFRDYQFNSDVNNLVKNLSEGLNKTSNTKCGKFSHILLKRVKQFIENQRTIRIKD
jgi:UDP-xylose:glucoside alpha-1,3-xylosyltransferase